MVKRTAIGKRDSDGVRVVGDSEFIPYLSQWVRDYVDERKVTDGMVVLVADVSELSNEVDELTINEVCASDRAKHEDEKVDTITITSFE